MREGGAVICLFGMLAVASACGNAIAPVPPTLREADVVVVGGTVDGVRAAIAAKKAGASVFLVAPRAYLGEDRAATFQLDRLPSDDPSDPVIREIFNPLYAKPVPRRRFPRTPPMRPGSC